MPISGDTSLERPDTQRFASLIFYHVARTIHSAQTAVPAHDTLVVMDLTLERASRQPHVLLADGDEVTAFAVRTLLQQCGYRGGGDHL